MKHIRKISANRADAFSDFLNTVWGAWQDFLQTKKNEIRG